MAFRVRHTFQSAVADGADVSKVQASHWNADLDVTMASGVILGRSSANDGAVEELDPAAARALLEVDQAGTAADLVTTHEGAVDPHPQYLTSAEGNSTYAALSHTHTSAQITDFNEAAQDAVFAAIADSNSVDATYNDALNSLTLDVRVQMSVAIDASGVKLSGDAATPGNSKYYGTDSSGTKGFFSLPSGALSSSSAFATATTTIAAATYADITGCSISLAAGTWLIIGQVNIEAANAIVQAFVAITDGANAVVSEVAASRPASGTASLNSPFSCNPVAIVSPGVTTTYKLRGARGLTTHTGSWVAMDGNGVNTANHASNNTDKGSGIFAIRIA